MLTKRKREKSQVNKTTDVKGDISTETTEMQKILRNYYEELYANTLGNLEEMDKFLDLCNLSRLNQ